MLAFLPHVETSCLLFCISHCNMQKGLKTLSKSLVKNASLSTRTFELPHSLVTAKFSPSKTKMSWAFNAVFSATS